MVVVDASVVILDSNYSRKMVWKTCSLRAVLSSGLGMLSQSLILPVEAMCLETWIMSTESALCCAFVTSVEKER